MPFLAAGWPGSAPNYFLPVGVAEPAYTLHTPGWLPFVLEEQRACRDDVVVFDQTLFSKFLLKGRDRWPCCNGCAPTTSMWRPANGVHGDAQPPRRIRERSHDHSPRRARVLHCHGFGAATRDFAWIERGIDEHECAVLVDVSSAFCVLSVMGPKARRCSRDSGRTMCRTQRCRSRRRRRSMSAMRGCVPRE